MGWHLHYQLLRDTPLTADELAAVAALNLEAATTSWDGSPFGLMVAPAARADRVVAEGSTQLPLGESDDAERLDIMVVKAWTIVAGAELRIADDFGAFGWDPDRRSISGARRTPRPVDVVRGELVDPKTLTEVPLPPVVDRVAALLARVAAGAEVAAADLDDEAIGALLTTLPATERDDPRREPIMALLARAEPDRVVAVGFARYAGLATCYEARSAIERAMARLARPVDLADAFLAVWRAGQGVYYYGDLPLTDRFRDAVAPLPAVVAQMIADVLAFEVSDHGDDLAGRRAEHAVAMLARGRTDAGLHALIALIDRWRGRPLPWRLELGVLDRAHEHLARHGDVRVFATLLHFLATMTKDHGCHRTALEALARLDPDRARPIVFAIDDLGALTPTVVIALTTIGGDDALARLRALARHPDRAVWLGARRALEQAGLDPGLEPVPPPPEELVTHPDRDTRHKALRELHDRKDRSLMLSLCAAEALDALLRARTDDSGLPFSWYGWDQVLPPEVPRMRADARLRWLLGDGAAAMGPQVRWPAIEPILATDAATVAASMPSLLYRLPADALAALRAEEAALLARLADGQGGTGTASAPS